MSARAEADTVAVEVRDAIAWVRFNRPEKRNAMSPRLNRQMLRVINELEFRDEALRAVAHRAMQRKTGARGLRTILETVLLAWNFAERYVDNEGRLRSRPLPQPRDGGVRHLKGSQLQPLLQAVNSAYTPSPNS